MGNRGSYSSTGINHVRGVKNYLGKLGIDKIYMRQHCLNFIEELNINRRWDIDSWKSISFTVQNNWNQFVIYTKNIVNDTKTSRAAN